MAKGAYFYRCTSPIAIQNTPKHWKLTVMENMPMPDQADTGPDDFETWDDFDYANSLDDIITISSYLRL